LNLLVEQREKRTPDLRIANGYLETSSLLETDVISRSNSATSSRE
jgi:hypothetical protein